MEQQSGNIFEQVIMGAQKDKKLNEVETKTHLKKTLKEDEHKEDDDNSATDVIVDTDPEEDHSGDSVKKCPVCGANFFGKDAEEAEETGKCPVCGEEIKPEEIGEVQDDDVNMDDIEKDLHCAEDDIDDAESDLNIEDEEPEEDHKDEPDKDEEEPKEECSHPYYMEDKHFNAFLTKFVTENYNNAKSMKVESAHRSGKRLVVECSIAYTNGKIARTRLVCEDFDPKEGKGTLTFKESGFLTKKGSKAPFVFETLTRHRAIYPKRMKYDYVVTEGKNHYQVYGSLITESKKK